MCRTGRRRCQCRRVSAIGRHLEQPPDVPGENDDVVRAPRRSRDVRRERTNNLRGSPGEGYFLERPVRHKPDPPPVRREERILRRLSPGNRHRLDLSHRASEQLSHATSPSDVDQRFAVRRQRDTHAQNPITRRRNDIESSLLTKRLRPCLHRPPDENTRHDSSAYGHSDCHRHSDESLTVAGRERNGHLSPIRCRSFVLDPL